MFFDEIDEAQPDPIFGLLGAFKADVRREKVDLMVGVYKDDSLRSELLESVKKAEKRFHNQMADYLPIDGLSEMGELLGPVVFGEAIWKENRGRIYAAHTVGGTGALRVGAELIAREPKSSFFVPNYTWPNHRSVLERAGCHHENYPYYSKEKRKFDLDATLSFLKRLPERSTIILHACCHNPTGSDPTAEEWKEISKVMKEKKLLPFFDCAYQGLGDGIEQDVESIRVFMRDEHEMVIAYSCSKNFSMYCQRVGALFIVTGNAAVKSRVGSHVKKIIRALYSNPPAYGAWIVSEVLKQDDLRSAWQNDLEKIRHRLDSMRKSLIQRLKGLAKKIGFDELRPHKGMFSFLDIDRSQIQKLIDRYAIYMIDNGRISISGLNAENIEYVANSLIAVCEKP